MFIDTHCHLNLLLKKQFDVLLTEQELATAPSFLHKAAENNVGTLINVGTSLIESANCVALTRYPNCYAAVGIHPNDATAEWKHDFNEIKSRWLSTPHSVVTHKIVAIGEVGLDYHYPEYKKQRQHDLFKTSIDCALEKDLALIIHTRDAADDTLRILEEYKNEPLRGVVHCFSEGFYFAQQVIAQGLHIGIGGTLTYPKNHSLREVVTKVSLESIVLETDAPFLPPQSLRGTVNTPANIPLIADYIATIRNESLEKIADTIYVNSRTLFRI